MTIKALGKAILGVAAVSLWGLAPGCGPSIGAYCNKVCDCVGCSDSELDECVDEGEDFKKAAEEAGCGSEYNDVLGCSSGEFTCVDGDPDLDGCDAEGEAFSKCMSGADIGIGLDACEKYLQTFEARYEECGVDVPPGIEIAECTDEVAAQAACIEPCLDLVPCDCLAGSGGCSGDEVQPYSDCISACI